MNKASTINYDKEFAPFGYVWGGYGEIKWSNLNAAEKTAYIEYKRAMRNWAHGGNLDLNYSGLNWRDVTKAYFRNYSI